METKSIFPLPEAGIALRVAIEKRRESRRYYEDKYLRFFLLPADPRLEEEQLGYGPGDAEWAMEVMAALQLGWAKPSQASLEAIQEELAMRRAIARRFGRELAGMTLRVVPDLEYREAGKQSPALSICPIQRVPLLWMGVLMAWAIPPMRTSRNVQAIQVLQGQAAISQFIETDDDLRWPSTRLPEKFWEVARVLELEVQEEFPDPRALARQIRETAARAAYLYRRAPHETALARWEELEKLLERLAQLRQAANHFLTVKLGYFPADPAAVRELQEALEALRESRESAGHQAGRSWELPRSSQELAARRRERILALAERRATLRLDGVVAEVGLCRALIRSTGECRPLDELPDNYPGLADLLEEEASHLEELAARYRRRAGALGRRNVPASPASTSEPEIPVGSDRLRYRYGGHTE